MPRVLLVLSICLLVSSVEVHRSKRSLLDFNSMIKCTLPDSLPVVDYADYGCYCGYGGSGTPVDALDRCCQVHDKCYGDALQHHTCWPWIDNPYTKVYKFQCEEATKTVTCPAGKKSNTPCQKFICDCDRTVAMCFASAGYNEKYVHFPRKKCK